VNTFFRCSANQCKRGVTFSPSTPMPECGKTAKSDKVAIFSFYVESTSLCNIGFSSSNVFVVMLLICCSFATTTTASSRVGSLARPDWFWLLPDSFRFDTCTRTLAKTGKIRLLLVCVLNAVFDSRCGNARAAFSHTAAVKLRDASMTRIGLSQMCSISLVVT